MSAPPPDRPRRSLLVAACGAALAVLSGPLAAQDPRSALAQTAARDWLVLTDRGRLLADAVVRDLLDP